MERLTIGKMAKLHCVSEKTLRLYHTYGLLLPESVDASTGYRYYSLRQSSQLDMITQMKAIGLSLKEIGELLERRDIDYLSHLAEKHISELEGRIRQLKGARRAAERLFDTCAAYRHKPVMDEVGIEDLAPRRMLRFRIDAYSIETKVDDAGSALTSWELCLRQVKRSLIESRLPLSLFRNVGCIVGRGDLEAGKLIVSEAFILVDDDYIDTGAMRAEPLPGGSYAAIYCDGMTGPEGGYRESEYLNRLLEAIRGAGFGIAGDYIGEVLAETPAFLYEGREMLVKLQIPVSIPPGRSGDAMIDVE